jgi:hypothetical protein
MCTPLRYSLLAVTASGLLLAQHGGGGHAGGGGHFGGSSGYHGPTSAAAGGYTGNRAVVPPPSYSGHLTFSTPGIGTTGLNRGPGRSGEAHPVWGRPPIRRPGRPGYGSGYYGVGLYPFLGYGYYGNDPYPYVENDPEPQPEPEPYAPGYDVMPEPGADYYPPVPYAPAPERMQAAPPTPEPPAAAATPITLILKSGQKMEVQNYAIMNGVFWDFTKQNSKRIPLAQVDVAASAKATDSAGGAFSEESFVINPN